MFQTVGVPLVKNALAGYNTSILSYGQVFNHMPRLKLYSFQV